MYWAAKLSATRVEDAANQLAHERYVLPEHVKTIVQEAGQHWDWMMTQ